MKNFSYIEAQIFIVNYMISHRFVGHKQTLFDNLIRYVPASDKKLVKDALEELIRKGFISTKRKHYGIHISLIPEKLDEIRTYIISIENVK